MITRRNRLISNESVYKKASVPTATETVTEMEMEFMVDLYEAVKKLLINEEKVSLINLSELLLVSTTELSDYLGTIIRLEDSVRKEYSL